MELSGVEAGEKGYMPFFQLAVMEFMESLDKDAIAKLEKIQANWLTRGQPHELQRKQPKRWVGIILNNLLRFNLTALECEVLYLSSMKTKPGWNCCKCESSAHHMFLKITCFCRHDFNDSLGKVKIQLFWDKFPAALADFQMAWVEYMKYCYCWIWVWGWCGGLELAKKYSLGTWLRC